MTGRRASERWSELLAAAFLHLLVIAVILALFTMVAGVATISPPTTSPAMAGHPDLAGTASSLLGLPASGSAGWRYHWSASVAATTPGRWGWSPSPPPPCSPSSATWPSSRGHAARHPGRSFSGVGSPPA